MKNANPISETFIAASMSVSADSLRFWHSSYTWISTSAKPRPNPADRAPNKIRDPFAKCTPRLSSACTTGCWARIFGRIAGFSTMPAIFVNVSDDVRS